MGVKIPQPFRTKIEGPIGPVTVDGIPDTFHINIDKLPDTIPKIQLGIDPLTLNPVTLNPVTLTLTPVELNLRLKEVPETRTHLPADFTVGLSVLGMDLLCLRLCGEAQMITEPYHPNPCERCGTAAFGAGPNTPAPPANG